MQAEAGKETYQIRRAEPDDYQAMARLYAGPKVIWGTLQLPFPSAEAWRKRITEPAEGYYSLVACAGGEVVGQLGLQTFPSRPRRRHAARIGMAVRDDWQGRGVGSALMQAVIDLAERWMNIPRLELEVYVDNEPAIRLYKRFGFAIEGTMVQYAYRDGKYVDTYTMARIKEGG